MHAVLIGAGALGRLYGVHLAAGGADVSFVVRESRPAGDDPFIVERFYGPSQRLILERPRRVTRVPDDADLLLLAVRAEHLTGPLTRALTLAPPVPIIALTPLLPPSLARLEAALGRRVIVALPAVASRLDADRVVRYFVPPLSETSIDRDAAEDPLVRELVETLTRAGLPSGFKANVRDRNPATTILFYPLSLALALAGSMARLLSDRPLLTRALRACRELAPIARAVGPVEPGVSLLVRCSTPRLLRAGIGAARWILPDLVTFIEDHFGTKLSSQHLCLGRQISELAEAHSITTPQLDTLLRDLEARRDAQA